MRTTLEIEDGLMRRLKKAAVERHRTLRSLVEDAIRADLARGTSPHPAVHERPVTYGGRGLREGVNLDSNADLLDTMEGR